MGETSLKGFLMAEYELLIGDDATDPLLTNGIAVGNYARAVGEGAIAFGAFAEAQGKAALSIGYRTKAIGDGAIAIGDGVVAEGDGVVKVSAEFAPEHITSLRMMMEAVFSGLDLIGTDGGASADQH